MPYIKKDRREAISGIRQELPENAGELNYEFTRDIQDYVMMKGLSYQTINDVIGALEGAKAEFQRRVVAPYEDLKIQQNGDL